MTTLALSISDAPSLIDIARVIIYDCNVFLIQATALGVLKFINVILKFWKKLSYATLLIGRIVYDEDKKVFYL
jgi:hypothetical protein